jgi:hypothetical protein
MILMNSIPIIGPEVHFTGEPKFKMPLFVGVDVQWEVESSNFKYGFEFIIFQDWLLPFGGGPTAKIAENSK